MSKRFKDYVKQDEVHEHKNWTIGDIFEMLDDLAERIDKLEDNQKQG